MAEVLVLTACIQLAVLSPALPTIHTDSKRTLSKLDIELRIAGTRSLEARDYRATQASVSTLPRSTLNDTSGRARVTTYTGTSGTRPSRCNIWTPENIMEQVSSTRIVYLNDPFLC